MTLSRPGHTLLILLLLFAGQATAQLSGTKAIGSGGDYATFADAINALNTNGVAAPGVEFRIIAGTYTEPAPLTIDIVTNKPDATAPVLFKPQTDATVVLNVGGQVTGSRWALKIGTASNSVDYITLDGSNVTGGSTRDWTIKATAATYGIEPVDVYGDYVALKHCVIDMNTNGYSGSGYGISFRDAVPTATYGTVQNCKVTGNNAISIGRGTAADMPGFVIEDNEIHALNRGIYLYRSSTATIRRNEIVGDAYNGYPAGACYGIYIASPSGNTGLLTIDGNTIRTFGKNGATTAAQTVRGIAASGPGTYVISGNKVYDLYNGTSSASGTPILYGIQLSAGGSTSSYGVYNNFVAGLLNNDPDASATVYTYGIHYNTSGNAAIAFNTVVVDDTERDHITAAICLGAGNAANNLLLMNNIAINHNTSPTYASYAIIAGTTTIVTSNNNDLYADGETLAYTGRWAGVDQSSLADWQTASGHDAASVSVPVTFSSVTDLHLAGSSIGDDNLTGTMLPGITTDIDGDTRSATTPYMGADENLDVPLPVQLASFSALRASNDVQLSWKTVSEVNNYGFYVERKLEGTSSFIEVPNSFVAGHATTLEPQSYTFTDNTVTPGVWYYRLRQVDLDGSFGYSEPVKVEFTTSVGTETPATYGLSQNYPNPFNPSTDIQFSLAKAGTVTLTVYDMLGREVATLLNGERAAGVHHVMFNAINLPSGAYFYALKAGSFMSMKSMMLVK